MSACTYVHTCIVTAAHTVHPILSLQVKKFSSSDLTLNSDLVEFHFDDYQRLFHIVGGTLR